MMVLYYSPVGCDFREEGRPRGNLRPETPFYTGFSGFVLEVPAPLKLFPDPRKASNSANAQLTVCRQRLLRRLLQSSSQFMLPKVLASLESQPPQDLVTWLIK